MARCVLGFAVLNVMNAVICLDYCRYDKSILPRRLPKPLPSVWPTFFCSETGRVLFYHKVFVQQTMRTAVMDEDLAYKQRQRP